jgi:hypothetical protein
MGTLIGVQDLCFFRNIAAEVNELSGIECRYWAIDKKQTIKDPVYDEVVEEIFHTDPVTIIINAQNPENSNSAREEGKEKDWLSTVWVAVSEFCTKMEKAGFSTIEKPQSGDVIDVWDEYYDVLESHRDGILDNERRAFVMWRFKLRRKSSFEPKRRTEP